MDYGMLCLIPPALVLGVAIKTKKTTSSLMVGVLSSYVLMYGLQFLNPFIDLLYEVATDEDTIWVIAFTGLMGIIIALLEISGATEAFTNVLSRYANTGRKTMLVTFLLGVLLFIDDYLSVSIRGTMVKIYDKNQVPRAMLSYIADSTASPLCILVPIGTWAVFYQSVFAGYTELAAYGTPFAIYCQAIPFMFYGWVALLICFLVSTGIMPPLGGMKKEYERAAQTGVLYGPASAAYNKDTADDSKTPPAESKELPKRSDGLRIACFFLPLALLVAVVIATGDLLVAEFITIGFSFLLYLLTRVADWNKLMDASLKGFADMLTMMLIIMAALMLRTALIEIGLPDFVVNLAKPYLSIALFPALAFIICAVLTFATGSTWGVTVAVSTILIPLCLAISANPILIIAAIVSGAAFGAHICFYADVTVFASIVSKMDNMEHAVTQLPYGMLGAVISVLLYLIAGFLVG